MAPYLLLRKTGFYIRNVTNKYIILGNLHNTAVKGLNAILRKRSIRCNICGWEGYKFYAMIGYHSIRYNAVCPHCFSKERHRSFIFYLEEQGIIKSGLRCLDIGPVKSFRGYMEGKGCFYFSIDICSSAAMSKMDITNLGIKSSRFDLIICYHVLEHVMNDEVALREMYRVLKPEGKCFIQVPFNRDTLETMEYGKSDAKECDHVRSYGRDVPERIAQEGFVVQEVAFTIDDSRKVKEYALGKTDEFLFIGHKTQVR